MEHIHGLTVKEFLYKNECDSKESLELANIIGNTVAKMHNATLIHGDLTTSNFMLRDGKFDDLGFFFSRNFNFFFVFVKL